MKTSTLLELIRFWPPFIGAGIKVTSYSPDYLNITVQMNMYFWNKNYVGSHFGGSPYSMTDPFYMLILIKASGNGYIVWDKSATIRYKKPAKGSVYATFQIASEYIEQLRQELETQKKVEPEFTILIKNKHNETVAEIKKVLYVSKKARI